MAFTYIQFFQNIYHSEEEAGNLEMFAYIFHHPCHSFSFCPLPKLSKARVITDGVNEIGLMLKGEHMPKLFSGLDLVFLHGYAAGRRGGGPGVEVVLFQTLTRIKS